MSLFQVKGVYLVLPAIADMLKIIYLNIFEHREDLITVLLKWFQHFHSPIGSMSPSTMSIRTYTLLRLKRWRNPDNRMDHRCAFHRQRIRQWRLIYGLAFSWNQTQAIYSIPRETNFQRDHRRPAPLVCTILLKASAAVLYHSCSAAYECRRGWRLRKWMQCNSAKSNPIYSARSLFRKGPV